MLQKILEEFESKISHHQSLNLEVSNSNVGWHIEHTFLTIYVITEGLKKSNPDNYKWSFKLPRYLVFAMKKIPRGRAKAPKIVQPTNYDELSLMNHYNSAKAKLIELYAVNNNQFIEHPFFGHLKLKDTIKFLEIHSKHHLSIINDILNSKSNA